MNTKVLSLFSNAGIGETYLNLIGFDVVVANELLPERCNIYRHFHPNCNLVQGDITRPDVFASVVNKSIDAGVNIIIATPPCQGMSVAGKMDANDPRNTLIVRAMAAFKEILPDLMLIENVPQMLKTSILINGQVTKIIDFITKDVGCNYEVKYGIYDAADYGTAQHRRRAFVRIIKKGLVWGEPSKQKKITVRQAIGDLPSLESGEDLGIRFHSARKHSENHIHCMRHTPTGKSAHFNPTEYCPQFNGRPAKGFSTTYKRIDWDKPAPTVTMSNGAISSQNNVHPGRLQEDGTYSDARVLTILELLRLTGLPDDWNIPEYAKESTVRHIIGEAVPPKMMLAFFESLTHSVQPSESLINQFRYEELLQFKQPQESVFIPHLHTGQIPRFRKKQLKNYKT